MKQKKKNIRSEPNKYNNFLNIFWPYFIIIFCGIALYWHTLTFDYTYLDDNELILNNLNILKNIRNIGLLFREDVFFSYNDAFYRPLLNLSFMIDAQWGGDFFYFHLTNIIIHVINSCLLLYLLLQLGYQRDFSFFSAIIFTVHPVLTQAVAWIGGRNDSLLALFILLSFISFVNYLKSNKLIAYFIHLLFFFCALLTKETAFLFIPVGLLYFFLFIQQKKLSQQIILCFLGWFIICLIWLFMRNSAMQHPIHYSIQAILLTSLNSLPGLIQFIGKIFFPVNLSVLPTIQDTTFVWGILAFIILISMIVFLVPKKRFIYIIWGAGWFFLFLAPSFIWPNINDVVYLLEHRVYLPMIGLFFIFAEMKIFKNLNLKKLPHLLLVLLIILGFSAITYRHSNHFRNRLSFWLNAAENSPHHPLAQRNLGAMYFLDEQYDKAEIYFKKSLALNPNEPMAHMNLGLIAMNRNQFAKAESLYIREIQINPNYENVYFNLGILYYRTGKRDLAEQMWKKTIQLHKNFIGAYINLAILCYEQNKIDQARRYLGEARRLGGNIPPELVNIIGLP